MKRIDKKKEAKEFSRHIELIAANNNMTLVDAIIEYCDTTGLEMEVAVKLISVPLKKKIKEEATFRNQLKIKKPTGLPI